MIKTPCAPSFRGDYLRAPRLFAGAPRENWRMPPPPLFRDRNGRALIPEQRAEKITRCVRGQGVDDEAVCDPICPDRNAGERAPQVSLDKPPRF